VKNQQPTDGGAAGPEGEVRLHQVSEECWTWSYVEPATGVELYSNSTFSTREAATASAGRAYPDLTVVEDKDSPKESGESGDSGKSGSKDSMPPLQL
jgi:hypothetical protein